MQNKTVLAMVAALAAGLAASVLVSRIVAPPFAVVQQALTAGDTEITVSVFPGDQVDGVFQPRQTLDVFLVESGPMNSIILKPLAEQVQVVAIEMPKQVPVSPTSSQAASRPAGLLASGLKLRVTKDQAERLQPHKDLADLRFIARQPPEKK